MKLSSHEREDAAQRSTTAWTLRQGWPATGTEAGAYEQGHLAGSAWAQDRSDTADKAEQEQDRWWRKWCEAEERAVRAEWLLDEAYAGARPLAPDAITDEMVERARNAPSFDGRLSPTPRLVREMLTAALTEPTRPEGAEDLDPIVDEMLESYWRGDLNGADVPDFLAERGVRVTEDEEK